MGILLGKIRQVCCAREGPWSRDWIALGFVPSHLLEDGSRSSRWRSRTRSCAPRACVRHRARPSRVEMIAFIDKMKDRFGGELVCRTMRAAEVGFITVRGYRAATTRPVSARRLSDKLLAAEITRPPSGNHGVYGVRRCTG